MDLAGKVAVITGSGIGIGRAVALNLAKKGASIVVNYSRSIKEAQSTAEEIKKYGVDCLVYQASVDSDLQVQNMMEASIEQFGRIDILVNNAGATTFVKHDDLEGLKDEHWDQAMNVNVKGVFYACWAAAPELKKTKGCIVNIASVAGFNGKGSSIAYSASKAAAINMTKSLVNVLGPEVRVNAVAPGVVMTRWMEGRENFVERGTTSVPLGRVAYPEDVSEVVLSLITGASFVTGQTIVVDGGKYN